MLQMLNNILSTLQSLQPIYAMIILLQFLEGFMNSGTLLYLSLPA